MDLNLLSDIDVYQLVANAAEVAAIDTHDNESFRAAMAVHLEKIGYAMVAKGWLPDFKGDDPDNIEGVDWTEMASHWDRGDWV
jgi:hypothetical protein